MFRVSERLFLILSETFGLSAFRSLLPGGCEPLSRSLSTPAYEWCPHDLDVCQQCQESFSMHLTVNERV